MSQTESTTTPWPPTRLWPPYARPCRCPADPQPRGTDTLGRTRWRCPNCSERWSVDCEGEVMLAA
jgi:hypothetical protein